MRLATSLGCALLALVAVRAQNVYDATIQFSQDAVIGDTPTNQDATASATVSINETAGTVSVVLTFADITDLTDLTLFGPITDEEVPDMDTPMTNVEIPANQASPFEALDVQLGTLFPGATPAEAAQIIENMRGGRWQAQLLSTSDQNGALRGRVVFNDASRLFLANVALSTFAARRSSGVAPSVADASATAEVVIDPNAATAIVRLDYMNLTAADLTTVVLFGPVDAVESVAEAQYNITLTVTGAPTPIVTDPLDLAMALPNANLLEVVEDMRAGRWQMQLNTAADADGVVRGQIVFDVQLLKALADLSQFAAYRGSGTNPTNQLAMASGEVVINTDSFDVTVRLIFDANLTDANEIVLFGPADASTELGAEGVTAIRVPIPDGQTSPFTITQNLFTDIMLPAEDADTVLEDMQAGRWQMLVNSASDATGVLRGQIAFTLPFVKAENFQLTTFPVYLATGANPTVGGRATATASVVIDTNSGDVTLRLSWNGIAEAMQVQLFGPGDRTTRPGDVVTITRDLPAGVNAVNVTESITTLAPVLGENPEAIAGVVDDMISGLWQMQINSAADMNGAVRGRIRFTLPKIKSAPVADDAAITLTQFAAFRGGAPNPTNTQAAANVQVILDPNDGTAALTVAIERLPDATELVLFGPGDATTRPTDDGVVAITIPIAGQTGTFNIGPANLGGRGGLVEGIMPDVLTTVLEDMQAGRWQVQINSGADPMGVLRAQIEFLLPFIKAEVDLDAFAVWQSTGNQPANLAATAKGQVLIDVNSAEVTVRLTNFDSVTGASQIVLFGPGDIMTVPDAEAITLNVADGTEQTAQIDALVPTIDPAGLLATLEDMQSGRWQMVVNAGTTPAVRGRIEFTLPFIKASGFELNQFNVWRATGTNPTNQDATASGEVVINTNKATAIVRITYTNINEAAQVVLFGAGNADTVPGDMDVVSTIAIDLDNSTFVTPETSLTVLVPALLDAPQIIPTVFEDMQAGLWQMQIFTASAPIVRGPIQFTLPLVKAEVDFSQFFVELAGDTPADSDVDANTTAEVVIDINSRAVTVRVDVEARQTVESLDIFGPGDSATKPDTGAPVVPINIPFEGGAQKLEVTTLLTNLAAGVVTWTPEIVDTVVEDMRAGRWQMQLNAGGAALTRGRIAFTLPLIKATVEPTRDAVQFVTGEAPGNTAATASAEVVINVNSGDVTLRLTYAEIPDLQSLLLFGPAEVETMPNADGLTRIPIMAEFTPDFTITAPITGLVDNLDPTTLRVTLEDMQAGRWQLQLITQTDPNGVLRGQIAFTLPFLKANAALSQQAVQDATGTAPTNQDARGTGEVLLDANLATAVVRLLNPMNLNDITMITLFGPADAMTLPDGDGVTAIDIARNDFMMSGSDLVTDVVPITGLVDIDAETLRAVLTAMIDGQWQYLVRTTADPNGVLRGQIEFFAQGEIVLPTQPSQPPAGGGEDAAPQLTTAWALLVAGVAAVALA